MTSAKIQSHNPYDIAIAGAGAAGLTLGCLLAGAGLRVALIDPAPAFKPSVKNSTASSRTVALMNSSLNILRAAGVNSPEDLGTPLRVMRILDDSVAGRPLLEARFEASEMGLTQYGFNIPNDALIQALYTQAGLLAGLDILSGESFAARELSAAEVSIELKSGQTMQARLLVGADGRNSAVREAAGIAVKKHEYGQSAITCLVSHTRPHESVSTEFHRPSGPLAFVPMVGRLSSVVWVERTERVSELLKLRKDQFTAALEAASCAILGPLTLESTPESWPLCAMTADRLAAPRIALVAEAAHVMSPITAQGLNLSLRDVAVLAEGLVDAARSGIDLGASSVLETYGRRRFLDISTRTRGVDTMMRLVSTETLSLKGIRRAGLKAVSEFPPFKGLAMSHGLAPSVDDGRLAAGKPL